MALFFYKEKNKDIRAAAYLRLSIEDGDKAESNSIGNQRELIRDFAAERPGLHLIEEYADDGYTGTNFERPGFKRMMEDIKSGKINCIIVKDLSRLGRNYIEMGKYLEQIFPMMGIRFIAINDNYDNANTESSDSDSIVVPFKNLLNDSYCRDISIKVRSQLDMKRRKGEFIGGYAIYGYCKDKRNKNRLVVDEYAADIVRSIYRRKLEGMSAQAIAEQLNSENVLAPSEYKRLCGLNYHSGFKAGTHAKWQAIQVLRIENQKELIQRYISCKESLQNVPVMDFVDDGYTGSNFDRPGFQQMMDGVRNGKIDTIIVKDLSRFGRDYIGVGEYMEQIFPLLGVRLVAINDNYDSNNYKGTTLGMDVVVSNLVNTMYCRDAGKKLRTANQVKWRKGITTASAAPFGYQFDPDKKGAFIIDLPAAKIVRRIFDLAILGLGTREIAVMLNDENVPVPSVYNKENKAYGKETTYTIAPVILWDSSRVWKILTAYVYTGAMVLGKTKTLISGKSIVRTVPKGQQFITEGTHEAIVSREEFEKAQLVIKSNSHKVLMGRVDFPLKGKVRCGNCRRVMAHNFKQVVPTFWCREGLELVGQTQCTSEIFQVSDIESAVFQALKKELSLLDSLYGDIQKEEQDLKEAHKKANRRKTLMEQELKNLKGEKMRMYEEYAAGTLPLDTYKQKKQECDRRISEVEEKIELEKGVESTRSAVPGTVRAAAEQAENFLHGTRLTAGMVSAFIENVFVHDGGRIVVRFKYEQSIQDTVKALQTG